MPPPSYEEGHPLQALVTNLDASPYLGRLALCRIRNGVLRRGDSVLRCRVDGTTERVRITDLTVTEELTRVAADEAGPGEIIAIAGIEDVAIGETLTDPDDPRPLPVISVDEPSLSMMIGINTSPLAGLDGKLLTARQVRNRLDQELVGNVSLRVLDGDRPDAWEVQGRGELQLAVLVEQMRREGFELTIGKPQVVTRRIDGVLSEPVERLAIDVPEAYSGVVIGLLALRKGKMEQMVNHGTGWVRLDYLVPARGLIGFRTEFITETRGTGILHHVFEGFAPWFGDLKTRPNGSLVADRRGVSTSHALMSLQERGELFIGPAVDVYEGMVIGVNARPEDLDVNVAKEKKASNMRSAHAEELVRLAPPRQLSLEQALEFIREDEAVEVTPSHVRLRKVVLPAGRPHEDRACARGRRARRLLGAAEVRAHWAGPPARVTTAERALPERSVSRIVTLVPGFFARIAAPIELGEEVARPSIAVITSPRESPADAAGLPRTTSAITAPGVEKSPLRRGGSDLDAEERRCSDVDARGRAPGLDLPDDRKRLGDRNGVGLGGRRGTGHVPGRAGGVHPDHGVGAVEQWAAGVAGHDVRVDADEPREPRCAAVSSPTMIDCRSAVTEPVTVLSVPVPPALPTAVIRSPTATLADSPVVTVSRFEAPTRRSTATSSATS